MIDTLKFHRQLEDFWKYKTHSKPIKINRIQIRAQITNQKLFLQEHLLRIAQVKLCHLLKVDTETILVNNEVVVIQKFFVRIDAFLLKWQ